MGKTHRSLNRSEYLHVGMAVGTECGAGSSTLSSAIGNRQPVLECKAKLDQRKYREEQQWIDKSGLHEGGAAFVPPEMSWWSHDR